MAGADVTKMLLLGGVALFEPVNGSQIRRELISWRVEEWANVNPGSIYNGLATLTKQGSLRRHDLVDEGREVAVYELNDAGREHHHALVMQAIGVPVPYSSVAFMAAFTQAGLVPRADFLSALHARRDRLAEAQRFLKRLASPADPFAPPATMWSLTFGPRTMADEQVWVEQTIARIEDGDFQFADEPAGWRRGDDDQGWEMKRQQRRYLRLLGRPVD